MYRLAGAERVRDLAPRRVDYALERAARDAHRLRRGALVRALEVAEPQALELLDGEAHGPFRALGRKSPRPRVAADAAAFCQKALQYDLVLVPADSFGCPGYFRMAYCIDTEKVERSLPVLRKMMKEIYG